MPNGASSSTDSFTNALVIANPYSGANKNRLSGDEALSLVQALGAVAQLGWTKGPRHATELAREWAEGGGDLVAVVGGDGTVHEVARGLAGTGCAMAVLPSGSGNDFAAGIGCPSIAAGLAAIAGGQNVAVDVGLLNEEIFINSCGLLASGLVSGAAAGYWRWLGATRYSLAAARTLFSYRGQEVSWVFGDGEESAPTKAAVRGQYLLAEICNGPLTGGGFRFAPDASLTDGLLDAALITPLSLWAGLKLLPAAASGARIDHPALRVEQARQIVFESALPVAYHVDGEAAILPPGEHKIRVAARKLLVRMIRK